MNSRQRRTYTMFNSVREWLTKHADTLPAEARPVLERFRSLLAEIDRYATLQLIAGKSGPMAGARNAVEAMRLQQMLPLAHLTRRLFKGEPAILRGLRVPHKRKPTTEVLEAARLIVRTLKPHRAYIEAAQVDPTRIDRLDREARRIKRLKGMAQVASAERGAPTRELKRLFADAREECNTMAALVNAAGGKVGVQSWPSLTKVTKRLGRPRTPRGRRKPDA